MSIFKRIVVCFLTVSLILALMPLGTVAFAAENTTEFAGGDGTAENPYLISNVIHLNNVRNYLDADFKLTKNITFSETQFSENGAFYNEGKGFIPIGDSTTPFTGNFDGNGFAIKNLYINCNSQHDVGIFGYSKGDIKNLGMVDGEIQSELYSYSGGIVGSNYGTISNCYNTGSVTASYSNSSPDLYSGGIVGYNSGRISNCYNTGSVTATSSYSYSSSYSGGIVGCNFSGTISNCYNTGSVTATSSYSSSYSGGIVGFNDFGIISNCYNTGSVTATSSSLSSSSYSYSCGIEGYNYSGTISNCYYIDNTTNGIGSGTDTTVKCTAEEMQMAETFAGFDFNDTWQIDADAYYPFPTLKNLPHIMEEKQENTTEFAGGTGEVFKPYIIGTKEHLNNVRNYMDANFRLKNDIVFTEEDFAENGAFYNDGKGFIPIGDSTTPFTGNFDGNGFAIKNLYINCNSQYYVGIFGYSKGDIKNLGMVDGEIQSEYSSNSSSGGIVGYNSGTISNCYNTGSVTATSSYSSSGGIVGYNYSGTISNCYNTGSITATSTSSYSSSYSGGIVGCNSHGTISNCYNTGSITATSTSSSSYSGGIVGDEFYGTISNCYYIDNITNGIGSGTDTTVKCTAEEMQREETFVGFDFENVWCMDNLRDYLYPQLKQNMQTPDAEKIELISLPERMEIVEGTKPQICGGSIKITYIDGVEITTDIKINMLPQIDINTLGEQKSYIEYRGCIINDTVTVNVIAKSISAIKVTTLPAITEYLQGEEISGDLGKLTLYYNNYTTETIDLSQAELSYDNNLLGEIDALVRYGGFETTFPITVNPSTFSIEITKLPTKTEYLIGERLDIDGLEVTAYYENGTSSIITDYVLSGFNSTSTGTKTIKVSYNGFFDSFEITVICEHKNTEIRNAVIPNCPQSGYTGDTYCTDCGELISSGETIPTIHNFSFILHIEPTCENFGYDVYKCTGCDETKTELLDSTGHKNVFSHKTEATYTAPPYRVVVCEICGEETKTPIGVALTDFNADGIVDESDYTEIENNLSSLDVAIFDFDNDGKIDDIFDSVIIKHLTNGNEMNEIADINGDGKSNVKDLVRAKKCIAGTIPETEPNRNADRNLDGETDADDTIFIRKFILMLDLKG